MSMMDWTLHLPAICKVKTTNLSLEYLILGLHLPAICKVKTTSEECQ